MKNLLFPHSFQPIGWCVFTLSLILGGLIYFGVLTFSGNAETIVNDIAIVGITAGALFIVCSKEHIEDEMTRVIRLSSLLNAVYIYAVLLIICTVVIDGIDFLYFLTLNTVLFPIVFVCVFRLEMARYNKMNDDEE